MARLNMGEAKDDIHVCILCMRAIMNNKVREQLYALLRERARCTHFFARQNASDWSVLIKVRVRICHLFVVAVLGIVPMIDELL